MDQAGDVRSVSVVHGPARAKLPEEKYVNFKELHTTSTLSPVSSDERKYAKAKISSLPSYKYKINLVDI